MNVPLDKVCDYLREWGDLTVRELREMLADKMGDTISAYKGHRRGDLLALLMSDYPDWEGRPPVCTR
jgi:hypothetical protein